MSIFFVRQFFSVNFGEYIGVLKILIAATLVYTTTYLYQSKT